MYVFLFADADPTYEASAYCFRVGNSSIQCDRRTGWTVVEAYLNGFLAASNYIISSGLSKRVTGFDLCTSSKFIIKLVDSNHLKVLHDNDWKNPEGKPLFHVPLLKELYFHQIYYEERKIKWTVLTEVDDMVYREFQLCQDRLKDVLQEGAK